MTLYKYQKPHECIGCPAYETGLGYVPADGPPDAPILQIGESPGPDELFVGIPFVGRSGHMLDRWQARAGLPRERFRRDNTTRCMMVKRTKDGRVKVKPGGNPDNREPTLREQRECWRRHVGRPVHAAFEAGTARVLHAVGGAAARFLMGPHHGASTAGSIEWVELPPVGDGG